MKTYRVAVLIGSLVILVGLGLPVRQWVSHGIPAMYWSPFLPFMSPAVFLLLLMWLSRRVRATVLHWWSFAGLFVLAVVAIAWPAARLTMALYALSALVLNVAARLEGHQGGGATHSGGVGPA